MSDSRIWVKGFLVLGAFLVLLVSGCAAKADPSGIPTSPNPRLPTVQIGSGAAGGVALVAEVARTGEQRAKGLMFRKSLKDGEGMLFVFETDQVLAFWMKNTLLPLSIAYMTKDGTIREIHDMQPGSLEGISSRTSVRLALEVPQGWFARVGIKAGDRLEIPPLD